MDVSQGNDVALTFLNTFIRFKIKFAALFN